MAGPSAGTAAGRAEPCAAAHEAPTAIRTPATLTGPPDACASSQQPKANRLASKALAEDGQLASPTVTYLQALPSRQPLRGGQNYLRAKHALAEDKNCFWTVRCYPLRKNTEVPKPSFSNATQPPTQPVPTPEPFTSDGASLAIRLPCKPTEQLAQASPCAL